MKDDTVELVKFRRLMRALDLHEWEAVGVLESVWRFVRKNAPLGDVGRFSNVDIAAAIDWRGDADKLIAALCDGWLDDSPTHRLVCHDWYDHVPTFLVRRLNNWFGVGDTKTACSTGRNAWRRWAFGECSPGSDSDSKPPDDGRPTALITPDDGRVSSKPRPSSRVRAEAYPIQAYPPPPSPSASVNPSAPDPEPLSAAWSEVVVVVRACGVGDAEAACESARDRGKATPAEVRRLCEHFQAHPGAWSVGLLHSMISKIRGGEKVSWPEPSADYLDEQRRLEFAANRAKRQAELAEQHRQREQRRLERERLKQEPTIDMASALKQAVAGKGKA